MSDSDRQAALAQAVAWHAALIKGYATKGQVWASTPHDVCNTADRFLAWLDYREPPPPKPLGEPG